MLLLACSVVVLVGFIVLFKMGFSEGWNALGVIGALLAAVWIASLAMSIPMSRAEGHDKLARIRAFRDSIERARATKNTSDIERAAILSQIINWNEWLASERYWNDGLWDWWHIDEVVTTEDLK